MPLLIYVLWGSKFCENVKNDFECYTKFTSLIEKRFGQISDEEYLTEDL